MKETLTAKPLLRGVSHQAAFFVALGACAVLVASARSGIAMLAQGIYALSVLGLYGISAMYHRINWEPAARMRMRRLDHSAIFLLIAGTYTPVALLAMDRANGLWILGMAWGGAALGILQAIFWGHAPKPVRAAIYILFGLLVVPFLPLVIQAVGPSLVAWLALGGVLYIVGALCYAFKGPDPLPGIFGYHEVFHALVILASICHFVVVWRVSAS